MRIYEKFTCKRCNFSTYSVIKIVRHLSKEYNIELTKRDIKFILRNNVITRTILFLFILPIVAIIIILRLLLYPFHWLYELLD